ncbi:MAG: YqeG family HAD IIIA-type phosphatase [Clostridiales bacterium]|nr:YqeG family HAD IIIA-type phosphatase [Clostridiales bacterium]
MVFLRNFTPHLFLDSIFALPLDKLKKRGIALFIFDLDNTIVPWKSLEIDEATIAWFRGLPRYNLKACLLSNNKQDRVGQAANKLEIPFVCNAAKPFSHGFKQVFDMLGVPPQQTAVVGDQLFTDVWGGRRAGCFTVLVKPSSQQDFWGTRNVSRRLERLFWPRVEKNMKQQY